MYQRCLALQLSAINSVSTGDVVTIIIVFIIIIFYITVTVSVIITIFAMSSISSIININDAIHHI